MSTWNQYKKTAFFAIAIAVVINLTTGIQMCWGVLSHSMIAEYGWSTVEATRPYSIITFVSAFWAIVAGRWGDKFGHKWPIIFGAACMGSGLILSSLHQNPLLMCVTAGMLLGLSSSSMTTNTAGNSVQWVPYSYKGMVSGIITCGFALSSMYMSPLIASLNSSMGVLGTFRTMGAMALVPIILALCLLPDTRSKKYIKASLEIAAPPADGTGKAADHSKYKGTLKPMQTLKTKEFWGCFLLMGCNGIGGQTFVSQAVTISNTQIPAWGGAAMLVTLLAGMNFVGRLVVPTLSDKFGVMNVTRGLIIVNIINWFAFSHYHTPAAMIIGCAVLGFCFGGGCAPMLWTWCAHCFGTKYVSSMYGLTTVSWGLTGIISPMVAASLKDSTGSYNAAFMFIAIVCCIGLAASFLIRNNFDNDPKAVKLDAQA